MPALFSTLRAETVNAMLPLSIPFLQPDSSSLPDPANSHASAQLGWDEFGLVFNLLVTDTTPQEAPRASAAYQADSVELFLALDPALGESFQLVLSPGHDPAFPAPRSYFFDNRPVAFRGLDTAPEWKITPRPTGYEVWARLPWASLGIEPRPGLVIGTRIFVNDRTQTGRQTRYSWPFKPAATPFAGLTLLEAGGLSAQADQPALWLGFDPAESAARLNLVADPRFADKEWSISAGQQPPLKVTLTLAPGAPIASASLPISLLTYSRADEIRVLSNEGSVHRLPDTRAALVGSAFSGALSGRSRVAKSDGLSYALLDFGPRIIAVSRLPAPAFRDSGRVRDLLGTIPALETVWLGAGGQLMTDTPALGLFAARTTVTWHPAEKSFAVEALFYRLDPSAAVLPGERDEAEAKRRAFAPEGTNPSPRSLERLVARWWYKARRQNNWEEPLRYAISGLETASTSTADNRPRPLIVHLHGSGQATPDMAENTLATLAGVAGPEPILVYPFSPGIWSGPAVAELIDQLESAYPIDSERIYVVGFSLGGIGSWTVALDMPERLAGLVPIGGRSGSPQEAAILRNLPIWVINGADDPTTTPEDAALMVEALRGVGAQPHFTLLEGKAHGESQEAAYHHPGLFAWLLAQRRPTSSP